MKIKNLFKRLRQLFKSNKKNHTLVNGLNLVKSISSLNADIVSKYEDWCINIGSAKKGKGRDADLINQYKDIQELENKIVRIKCINAARNAGIPENKLDLFIQKANNQTIFKHFAYNRALIHLNNAYNLSLSKKYDAKFVEFIENEIDRIEKCKLKAKGELTAFNAGKVAVNKDLSELIENKSLVTA